MQTNGLAGYVKSALCYANKRVEAISVEREKVYQSAVLEALANSVCGHC